MSENENEVNDPSSEAILVSTVKAAEARIAAARVEAQEQEWITLEELRPGAIFETKNGIRAVKSEHIYYYGPELTRSAPRCILLGEYVLFVDREKTKVREIVLDGDSGKGADG